MRGLSGVALFVAFEKQWFPRGRCRWENANDSKWLDRQT
jgi:hypothetical protein